MDPRRELAQINRHLDTMSYTVGDSVLWSAIDLAASVIDDVYDEPGERVYRPAVAVQTIWLDKAEKGKRYEQGERYDVFNHLNGAVSLNAIRAFGIPVPTDDTKRVFDVWKYRGQYWEITDWEYSERLAGDDVIISVSASQLQLAADFAFEPGIFP